MFIIFSDATIPEEIDNMDDRIRIHKNFYRVEDWADLRRLYLIRINVKSALHSKNQPQI